MPAAGRAAVAQQWEDPGHQAGPLGGHRAARGRRQGLLRGPQVCHLHGAQSGDGRDGTGFGEG